jgi:hypothetical protein
MIKFRESLDGSSRLEIREAGKHSKKKPHGLDANQTNIVRACLNQLDALAGNPHLPFNTTEARLLRNQRKRARQRLSRPLRDARNG